MAGARKHMERSHRSYSKSRSEFGSFEQRAFKASKARELKGNDGFLRQLLNKAVSKFRKEK